MRVSLIVPVLVGLAVVVGCSGGGGGGGTPGNGSGSVTGTVSGASMTVRSALAVPLHVQSGVDIEGIVLADASNACAALTAKTQPPNIQVVFLQLGVVSGQTVSRPTATGTFTLVDQPAADGNFGVFQFLREDSSCNIVYQVGSSSGSVTLSSVSGDFTGTANVVTDDGDTLSMTFDAPSCPGAAAALLGASPPTCTN